MTKSISEPMPRAARKPRKPRTPARLAIRLAIVLILMLVVGFGLVSFQNMKEHFIGQFIAKMAPPPPPVAAVPAKVETMPRYLEGIGSLTAVHQVTLAPEVPGRVVKMMFTSGEEVKAGDPLVQIDDAPDRADLANFEAQARLAQVNLMRARTLAAKEFGSRQAVDQAQAALDQANAGIAKEKALIAEKLIRAPFAGIVGIRQINLGQYLNPGTAVATLTDLGTLYVDFTLPEQASGEIAVGQAVDLTTDAFQGKKFAGKLTTIEPQIDPQTRAIKLRATIPNLDHKLRPGMFANVQVVLPPQENVVTVPDTAIDYTPYGTSLFVIAPAGKNAEGHVEYRADQRFVKLGQRRDGRVAVESGLKAGELVASSGQLKIFNHAPVRLVTTGYLHQPATPSKY
jgi:membrane fusion protein, multidrug efflux system